MADLRPLHEAADKVGVHARTIQRWIRRGDLTAYKKAGDRRRYVDLDELARLMEPQPVRMADGPRQ